MNKKLIIIFAVLFILALIGGYFYSGMIGKVVMSFKSINSDKSPSVIYGARTQIVVTKDNLPQYLSSQSIVKDLPKDGKILLKLYNFNSGERQWEESYLITKGSVIKTNEEDADVAILIDSKYIGEFGSKGFCNALKEANQNGDLGSEMKISEVAFMWKYAGIIKYKSCIGM